MNFHLTSIILLSFGFTISSCAPYGIARTDSDITMLSSQIVSSDCSTIASYKVYTAWYGIKTFKRPDIIFPVGKKIILEERPDWKDILYSVGLGYFFTLGRKTYVVLDCGDLPRGEEDLKRYKTELELIDNLKKLELEKENQRLISEEERMLGENPALPVLRLKNGSLVQGKIKNQNESEVEMILDGKPVKILRDQILRIKFK